MNRTSLLACVVGLCVVSGCGPKSDQQLAPATQPSNPVAVETPETPSFNREAAIDRSGELMKRGRFAEAAGVLQRVLLAEPNDAEALFRFANAKAAAGDLADAVSVLDSIPIDHPQAGLAALGQSADWCMKLQRYDDAEKRYQRILHHAPQAAMAHRQLAYLYNRQGRRHEAAEHIQQLCRIGDVREDELHALMSLSDAVYDDPNQPSEVARDARPYWPIGPTGAARNLFTQRKNAEAAELLQQVIGEDNVSPSIKAFYGRVLAEAQDERMFLRWLAQADDSVKQYAEYWAGLGAYLTGNQQFKEAIRALAEAIRRDPTDSRSLLRIRQALIALGKHDDAKRWYDHYVNVRNVTLASNRIGMGETPDLDAFPELVNGLNELDRPLEAVLWEVVGTYYLKKDKEQVAELNRRRVGLASSEEAFADDASRLCGLDLDAFPLPEIEHLTDSELSARLSVPVASAGTPSFENVADEIGLLHVYRVGSEPQSSRFAIYQSVGGGVAVLDYDLDGFQDLYFAQGGNDPPEFAGGASNILYRATDARLRDVTRSSDAGETRYSIGVTAGDWNQDGFPDLVVTNLGANTLMINNGDGTFAREPTDDVDDATIMSTSVAMADVTGDALPDLVELNYLHDETLTRRPQQKEDGKLSIVGPLDFKPAGDRILSNDGRGGRSVSPLNDSPEMKATGLGLFVTDIDDQPGNEVFIGNDMYADRLWKATDSDHWADLAPTAGCAFGNEGRPIASMGIAVDDFDNSGTIDFHITNFDNAPVALFMNRGATFQDRAVQFRLADVSYPVLGFGCQAVDYANDGLADLVVSNGHVDDIADVTRPFRQPAQLFANMGDRFELTPVVDRSGYFRSGHVGRALARLDFNQDGKADLVVTHLEEQSALLINRTETTNHWLQLELVGTQCERNAIGAKVDVEAGDRQLSRWMTAGDGYLCRNEPTLTFGLGRMNRVARISVTWPDGNRQVFLDVPIDQRVLIIQGQEKSFPMRAQP